jgi:hypothetical protein
LKYQLAIDIHVISTSWGPGGAAAGAAALAQVRVAASMNGASLDLTVSPRWIEISRRKLAPRRARMTRRLPPGLCEN